MRPGAAFALLFGFIAVIAILGMVWTGPSTVPLKFLATGLLFAVASGIADRIDR